jgi:hypothetical protein
VAGGLHLGQQSANVQDVGSNLVSTGPLNVLSGGSPYTKGAWVELTSSTANDTSWVMIQCDANDSVSTSFAYDIGIGASGSEVVVVQNLVSNNDIGNETTVMFPLSIRKGLRIAARSSCEFASQSGAIKLTCFENSALSSGCGSSIDTYGFNAATNLGITVDPGGTANTKGAYAQVTASATNDLAGFFVCFDSQNITSGTANNVRLLIDLSLGASGSEKVVVPNISVFKLVNGGGDYHLPETTPYFPVPVKAGTRIAARAQSGATISPDRTIGITLYGVRI